MRVPIRRSSARSPEDGGASRVRVKIRRSSGAIASPAAGVSAASPSPAEPPRQGRKNVSFNAAAPNQADDTPGTPSSREPAVPPSSRPRRVSPVKKPTSQSRSTPARTSVPKRISSATRSVGAGAKKAVQSLLPFDTAEASASPRAVPAKRRQGPSRKAGATPSPVSLQARRDPGGPRTAASTVKAATQQSSRAPRRSKRPSSSTSPPARRDASPPRRSTEATSKKLPPSKRGPNRPRQSDPRKPAAALRRETSRPRKSIGIPASAPGTADSPVDQSDHTRIPTPPPIEPEEEDEPASASQRVSSGKSARPAKRKGPSEVTARPRKRGRSSKAAAADTSASQTNLAETQVGRVGRAFRKRLRAATRLLASESEDEEGAMAAAEAGLHPGRRRSMAERLTDADVLWALVDGQLKDAVQSAPTNGMAISLRAIRSLIREQFKLLSAKATRRRQMIAHFDRSRAYQRQLRQDVFARRRIVLDLRREIEALKLQRNKERQAHQVRVYPIHVNPFSFLFSSKQLPKAFGAYLTRCPLCRLQSAHEGLAYLQRLSQGSSLWT